MTKQNIQHAALTYARSAQPLDPEMGWRREDVQLAFIAGGRHQAAQLVIAPETNDVLEDQP